MASSTRTSPWRRPRCASRPPPVAGTFPRRATTPRGIARRSLRRRSAGDATRSAPRSGREAPRLCGSLEEASCPSTRSTPPCRRRRCVAEPAKSPLHLFCVTIVHVPDPRARERGATARAPHNRAHARHRGIVPPPNAAREKPPPRTRLTELNPPPSRALRPPSALSRFPRSKQPETREPSAHLAFDRSGKLLSPFTKKNRRVFSIPPTTATRAASGSWAS